MLWGEAVWPYLGALLVVCCWFLMVFSWSAVIVGVVVATSSGRGVVVVMVVVLMADSCRDTSVQYLHAWLMSVWRQNWVWLRLIFVGFHIAMELSSQHFA